MKYLTSLLFIVAILSIPFYSNVSPALAAGTFSADQSPASSDQPAAPINDPAAGVSFDQKLNTQLPLALSFKDEYGHQVRLGDYFGDKPVILIFAYYNCPNLCDMVQSNLAKDLSSVNLAMGSQYKVLSVSINPQDTPQTALDKKNIYLTLYKKPYAADNWHFLSGTQDAITQLTEAAGYHYKYDAVQKQYDHPTGLMVLTPQGRTSRYLFGLDFNPTDLRLSLVEASNFKIGTPVDQFFLLCYHYDPVTGRYNLLINRILQFAGVSTATVLGLFVGALFLRERRKKGSPSVLGNP